MADPTIKDLAYRGLASVLGGPVDIATMVMRPFGYNVPEQQVVGGSEWIGKQLEDVGLVSSARAPVQEFITSMAIPTPSGLAKGAALGGAALVGSIKGAGKTGDAIKSALPESYEYAKNSLQKWIDAGKPRNSDFYGGEIAKEVQNNLKRLKQESRQLPEGYFWRGTNNKQELDLVNKGVQINSKNILTGELEGGMSVSETPATIWSYGYKYAYPVKGDLVRYGSDGEPVLQNIKPATNKIMTSKSVIEKDRDSQKILNQQIEKLVEDTGLSKDIILWQMFQ